jgi:23S rRNA pseudouridine1911/1915/1917 synthase
MYRGGSTEVDVIYEDNHIIAVNKRPSQIVQGDKTGDTPLSELVKGYIKEKYEKPGEVYLGVIHRLDRPVSGVVLFARTSKALTRMNELFRSRQITKTYWAAVKKEDIAEEGTLVHYLKKNEQTNMSRAYEKEVPGSLRAELSYKILATSDNYMLLEVNPITGRHHQIRVQLSSMGCPIKGDVKYGARRGNDDASIHLHARKIRFEHPIKKEMIEIAALPPLKDVVWNQLYKSVPGQ